MLIFKTFESEISLERVGVGVWFPMVKSELFGSGWKLLDTLVLAMHSSFIMRS